MLAKLIPLVMVVIATNGTVTAMNQKDNDLAVVNSVDLARYVGRWYEIARLPNRFEKKCADTVTADYALRSDGKIDVINRCRKADGKFTTSKGKAKVVDKATNAKLKVTFFWPFSGDYWILDLGPNYEYAVVGAPNRKYLWILSRTPTMDEAVYAQLLSTMSQRGFDTSRVIKTAQPEGASQSTPTPTVK